MNESTRSTVRRLRAENAALTAEVGHARRHVYEAVGERDAARAEIERLTYDRNHPYGELAIDPRPDPDTEGRGRIYQRLHAGTDTDERTLADRDATIARVKAVADSWAGFGDKEGFRTLKEFGVADIRAALETPQT